MATVRVTFDFTLADGVSAEWFAEALFDALCADAGDIVPGAVDSVDSYDFRILD
jgi:hypothetical protein